MLKYPPIINTELTPEEIVGSANMRDFINHIKNYRPENKENLQMGEIIDRLQSQGFYPNGINDRGEVRFAVMVKSQCHQLFEGIEYNKMKMLPLDELQKIGRGGYSAWRNNQERLSMELKN